MYPTSLQGPDGNNPVSKDRKDALRAAFQLATQHSAAGNQKNGAVNGINGAPAATAALPFLDDALRFVSGDDNGGAATTGRRRAV